MPDSSVVVVNFVTFVRLLNKELPFLHHFADHLRSLNIRLGFLTDCQVGGQ